MGGGAGGCPQGRSRAGPQLRGATDGDGAADIFAGACRFWQTLGQSCAMPTGGCGPTALSAPSAVPGASHGIRPRAVVPGLPGGGCRSVIVAVPLVAEEPRLLSSAEGLRSPVTA